MTNEQMRSWRQCHPGCECPDCGTMIAAAYGLARDVCERAAADAGIKADLDEVLAEQFEDPTRVWLLHNNPGGYVFIVYSAMNGALHDLGADGKLPMA